jgi:hypothetical protein
MNGGDGGAAGGAGNGSAGGDLARSVVDHALRYRAQRPLVDALLHEVGLGDVADLKGLLDRTDALPAARDGAEG